jgi:CelD/BcsL family acetyltransferase involved in cellulose biosynthesis
MTELKGTSITAGVVSASRLTREEIAVWDRLCGTVESLRSPFLSAAYVRAVEEAKGGIRVCVLRRGGAPVGFLPFEFQTRLHRLVRSAQPAAREITNYSGLVAAPGLRLNAETLLAASGLHSGFFPWIACEQAEYGLPVEQQTPASHIDLRLCGGSFWQDMRRRKPEFWSKTESRERQIEKALGPLHFRLMTPEPERELANLIAHKSAQYLRTSQTDLFDAAWIGKLLRRLLENPDPNCTALLSTLYAGETWVASRLALRNRDLLNSWFPVYNHDLRKFSPGHLLLKCIAEAAPAAGISVIDFGPGDSQAKRDFSNSSHVIGRGDWHVSSPRSALYRLARSLRWRLLRWREGLLPLTTDSRA